MSQIIRRLMGGMRRAAPRISPDVSAYLDDLARSPEAHAMQQARRMAADDEFFGRPVDRFAGVEVDVPMSRQMADADVGLFGNPAVQRMLKDAEFRQAIGPLEGDDVVAMLNRNDRMNTLAGINARRYGGEQGELWNIAQDNIARSREASRRAAAAGENSDMIADATLGAGLGLGAMYAAGLVDREMDEAMSPPVIAAEAATDVWPEETMIMDEDASVYLEPSNPEDIADMIPPVGGDVYQPPDDMRRMASMLYPQIYDASMEGLGDVGEAVQAMAEDAADIAAMPSDESLAERDGFYMGRPNLPGLSDLQQMQVDALVRMGVSPASASDAIRGYRPFTDQEMEMLLKYGRGEMSW